MLDAFSYELRNKASTTAYDANDSMVTAWKKKVATIGWTAPQGGPCNLGPGQWNGPKLRGEMAVRGLRPFRIVFG
jgi:hypothetical protein